MRETTERLEAIEAGTTTLIGTDIEQIVNRVVTLLNDKVLYRRMSHAKNPYGDGHAAQRIVKIITTLKPFTQPSVLAHDLFEKTNHAIENEEVLYEKA